jgi:hypothetical protein
VAYLRVPIKDALELARIERDSLRLRAAAGGPCAPHWERAAEAAELAVRSIEAGWPQLAVHYLRVVARRWAIAAQCGGLDLRLAKPDA